MQGLSVRCSPFSQSHPARLLSFRHFGIKNLLRTAISRNVDSSRSELKMCIETQFLSSSDGEYISDTEQQQIHEVGVRGLGVVGITCRPPTMVPFTLIDEQLSCTSRGNAKTSTRPPTSFSCLSFVPEDLGSIFRKLGFSPYKRKSKDTVSHRSNSKRGKKRADAARLVETFFW